jgi:hypothetical protein
MINVEKQQIYWDKSNNKGWKRKGDGGILSYTVEYKQGVNEVQADRF